MHFVHKADLLISIGNVEERRKFLRRVKIEWNGPSNNEKICPFDYKIIDYEYLMNGNPTLKPIFSF